MQKTPEMFNRTLFGATQHCACVSRRQARCLKNIRKQTEEQGSWTRTAGAAVNGDCAVGSKRGVEWVPSTVEVKQPRTVRQDTAGAEGQTAGTETLAGPRGSTLHGNTQPGVSASLTASRVMTAGEISHTSVRRCSETETSTNTLFALLRWNQVRRGCWFYLIFYFWLSYSSATVDLSVFLTMAERTSSGLLTMMLEPTPAVAMTLPAEVREKLAELELELSEGKLTTLTQTTTPWDRNMWFFTLKGEI